MSTAQEIVFTFCEHSGCRAGLSDQIAAMKLRVIVEQDPQTGRFSAVFPERPRCASAGDTAAEALLNARGAFALWFEPDSTPLAKNAKLVELTV